MPKTKCKIDDYGRECSKCGRYKTRDDFSYSGGSHPHGRCSKCKACNNLYGRWRPGMIIDYVKGIIYSPSDIVDYPVKYPAPDIDKIINFKPIEHNDEGGEG